ncbi:hypothetical protein HK101_002233 [Irineochytrium annulatum]|nr:hypothetical protein HK101_002233 [Irineochytrium annulatum]
MLADISNVAVGAAIPPMKPPRGSSFGAAALGRLTGGFYPAGQRERPQAIVIPSMKGWGFRRGDSSHDSRRESGGDLEKAEGLPAAGGALLGGLMVTEEDLRNPFADVNSLAPAATKVVAKLDDAVVADLLMEEGRSPTPSSPSTMSPMERRKDSGVESVCYEEEEEENEVLLPIISPPSQPGSSPTALRKSSLRVKPRSSPPTPMVGGRTDGGEKDAPDSLRKVNL